MLEKSPSMMSMPQKIFSSDGLLYLEFCDAIKEGDGSRLLRCWSYLFLIFRATQCTDYTIEAFILLAQEVYFQSTNGFGVKMELHN